MTLGEVLTTPDSEFHVLAQVEGDGLRLHRLDEDRVVLSWGFAFGEISGGGITWHPEWSRGLPYQHAYDDAVPMVHSLRGRFERSAVVTFELGFFAPACWGPVEFSHQYLEGEWHLERDTRSRRIDPGLRFGVWTIVHEEFLWDGQRIRLMGPYAGGRGDGKGPPRAEGVQDCIKSPPYFVSLDGELPTTLPTIPWGTCVEQFVAYPNHDWVMVLMLKNGALRIQRSRENRRTSEVVPGQDRYVLVERWPKVEVLGVNDVRLTGSFSGMVDAASDNEVTSEPVALRLKEQGFVAFANEPRPVEPPRACSRVGFAGCVHLAPDILLDGKLSVRQGSTYHPVVMRGKRIQAFLARAEPLYSAGVTSAAVVESRLYATVRLSGSATMNPIDVVGVFEPKGTETKPLLPPPAQAITQELRLIRTNRKGGELFPGRIPCQLGEWGQPVFSVEEVLAPADRNKAVSKRASWDPSLNGSELYEVHAEGRFWYFRPDDEELVKSHPTVCLHGVTILRSWSVSERQATLQPPRLTDAQSPR